MIILTIAVPINSPRPRLSVYESVVDDPVINYGKFTSDNIAIVLFVRSKRHANGRVIQSSMEHSGGQWYHFFNS